MAPVSVKNLRRFAEEYVAAEPGRSAVHGWWRAPLLAAAPVDERFEKLARIAADDHLHPHDLLPSARSVIVFFIPFKKELARENRKGDRPCRNWGLAYVQTNALIERASRGLGDLLEKEGYRVALTPATHNFDEDILLGSFRVITRASDCSRLG